MSDLYTRLASSILFPLHERLKGHDTVRVRRDLEQSQWWSPERIQILQVRRLQALLQQVSQRIPYYHVWFQEQGLDANQFQGLADLAKLPIIDKAVIRAHQDEWRTEGATDLVAMRTSGSSGEPLRFWLSRHRISCDIAAKWRATRWWDVDIGDPEVVVWGSRIEAGAQDRVRVWRDRLFRSRLVPTHDLTEQRLDDILASMRRFRPRQLFGYPSALARLAWHARTRDLAMHNLGLRVAFTTSEVLRPEWREIISMVFGCQVANEYGARDAGFIARECPSSGLHITAEMIIVEIVDEAERVLPAGEEGEILITNLSSPEFPFIRYRTGDRGILDPNPCSCGRGLPLLKAIVGRANDGLIAMNGAWIHGSAFNHLLRELAGLRAYQIIQETRTQVRLLLSLENRLLDKAVEQRLVHAFQERLGAPVGVSVESVAHIPSEANGKYRHVICRVNDVVGVLDDEEVVV
ncbi:MAG: phenylacetate--CoA ligase family protein [Gammaproteobacteria bacterium]|nr:phenylacetate--CoA ligase family protein [Gammaproteobacteria bacterium]MCP5196487.1 phenylacetate--CoA ligase family protein [Gammaproteobacteria bacterium]